MDECPCAFYQRPRAATIATRVVSLAVASRLPFLVIKRGGCSTETVCVHVLNGLVLPRASHSGEIALAGSRRLRSTLAAAPVLFAHAVVTTA